MDRLLPGRNGNKKTPAKQPMSVLSVPPMGVSVKFMGSKHIVKDAPTPADITHRASPSVITGENGNLAGFICWLTGRKFKNGRNLPMSVLSVPYMEASVKFKGIKNIIKAPYTPTDNTDIGCFIGGNTYLIDFTSFFNMNRKMGRGASDRE